jgi:hypothetical protein
MRVLTYKRTHTGDPDNRGIFGINDCMGTIRNRKFDAVVGIGSKLPWEDSMEIAGKVTWIGVGPFRLKSPFHRGDLVAFEKFVLLDGDGPDFESLAPNLAKRFYSGNARSIINSYSKVEKVEIESLITRVIIGAELKSNAAVSNTDKLIERREKCARRFCYEVCKS